MIARDPLVLTATEGIEVFSIERINDAGDVLPVIINGACDLAWRGDGRDFQLCRGNHKTFVNKDVRAFGMIDDHESQMIVIVRFPKLGSDPQVVVTIMRHE